MSDKTKIKSMKLALVLNEESRRELIAMLSGQCNEVYLDDIYFKHLKIEEVKCGDGLKIEDIKLKRGKIKCLRLCAVREETC
ncbi:hypothetical protein [Tumebacillus permanentifrigoris]|uniref:Uncharacterized protein n=1 Tax=Tumebacillus permanentifrigoris TaxID=378543 RepID=A0A316DCS4_9BACL|nr:hypothetical protein [Tumebacillus permanentifrigoris]PWK13115.1 hypothetical protein C7459_108135 [Tumebacillus permanentifrigoris]